MLQGSKTSRNVSKTKPNHQHENHSKMAMKITQRARGDEMRGEENKWCANLIFGLLYHV
jgi:hypothetical protein